MKPLETMTPIQIASSVIEKLQEESRISLEALHKAQSNTRDLERKIFEKDQLIKVLENRTRTGSNSFLEMSHRQKEITIKHLELQIQKLIRQNQELEQQLDTAKFKHCPKCETKYLLSTITQEKVPSKVSLKKVPTKVSAGKSVPLSESQSRVSMLERIVEHKDKRITHLTKEINRLSKAEKELTNKIYRLTKLIPMSHMPSEVLTECLLKEIQSLESQLQLYKGRHENLYSSDSDNKFNSSKEKLSDETVSKNKAVKASYSNDSFLKNRNERLNQNLKNSSSHELHNIDVHKANSSLTLTLNRLYGEVSDLKALSLSRSEKMLKSLNQQHLKNDMIKLQWQDIIDRLNDIANSIENVIRLGLENESECDEKDNVILQLQERLREALELSSQHEKENENLIEAIEGLKSQLQAQQKSKDEQRSKSYSDSNILDEYQKETGGSDEVEHLKSLINLKQKQLDSAENHLQTCQNFIEQLQKSSSDLNVNLQQSSTRTGISNNNQAQTAKKFSNGHYRSASDSNIGTSTRNLASNLNLNANVQNGTSITKNVTQSVHNLLANILCKVSSSSQGVTPSSRNVASALQSVTSNIHDLVLNILHNVSSNVQSVTPSKHNVASIIHSVTPSIHDLVSSILQNVPSSSQKETSSSIHNVPSIVQSVTPSVHDLVLNILHNVSSNVQSVTPSNHSVSSIIHSVTPSIHDLVSNILYNVPSSAQKETSSIHNVPSIVQSVTPSVHDLVLNLIHYAASAQNITSSIDEFSSLRSSAQKRTLSRIHNVPSIVQSVTPSVHDLVWNLIHYAASAENVASSVNNEPSSLRNAASNDLNVASTAPNVTPSIHELVSNILHNIVSTSQNIDDFSSNDDAISNVAGGLSSTHTLHKEASVKSLQTKLDVAEKNIKTCEDVIEGLQGVIRNLEEENYKLESELHMAKLSKTVSDATNNATASLKAKLQETEDELNSLKNINSELENKLEFLKEENANLQSGLQKANKESAPSKTGDKDLSASKPKLEEVEKQLESLQNSLAQAQTTIEKLRDENASLWGRLQVSEREQTIEVENEDDVNALRNELILKDDEIRNLKESLESFERKAYEMSHYRKTLREEIEKLCELVKDKSESDGSKTSISRKAIYKAAILRSAQSLLQLDEDYNLQTDDSDQESALEEMKHQVSVYLTEVARIHELLTIKEQQRDELLKEFLDFNDLEVVLSQGSSNNMPSQENVPESGIEPMPSTSGSSAENVEKKSKTVSSSNSRDIVIDKDKSKPGRTQENNFTKSDEAVFTSSNETVLQTLQEELESSKSVTTYLLSKCSQLDNLLEKEQSEKSKYQVELEMHKEILNSLKSQLNSKSGVSKRLNTVIEMMRSKECSDDIAMEQLKSEIKWLVNENQKVFEKITATQAELCRCKEENSRMQNDVCNLKRQLVNEQYEHAKVNNELKHLRTQLLSSQSSLLNES